MSFTIVKAIFHEEKKCHDVVDLPNSWLSAPIVWNYICEKYLDGISWFSAPQELWGAWMLAEVPKHTAAVLLFTLDRLYVSQANYARFREDIGKFVADLGATNHGHWPRIAEILENFSAPAVGIRCNTIAGDSWDVPGDWFEVYSEVDSRGVVASV